MYLRLLLSTPASRNAHAGLSNEKYPGVCRRYSKTWTGQEHKHRTSHTGSNKSQNCQLCEKCFKKPSELKYHIGRKHPNSNICVSLARPSHKEYNLVCEYCAKTFANERNFRVHLTTHNIIPEVCGIACPICDFKDSTKENILNHFSTAHDILMEIETLNFHNIQEFSKWKTKIEKVNHFRFVPNRGAKRSKEFSKTTYSCHLSGNYKNHELHLRHLKTQGSCRINGLCPASLKVYDYMNNNKCKVEYTKTHVGHDLDIRHVHLIEEERKNIAVKIAAKIPFKDILDGVRDSVTNCKIERNHLLTRKDLYNIESSFNLRNNNLVVNTKPTDEEECKIIESISRPQELNEDDVVPILDLEKSISNLCMAIRINVKTVGDFRGFKKLVASIEPTLQAIQESKTRKASLSFTKEKSKPGAIPKITPQRNNPLLFSTNKKIKTTDKRKNVNVTYDSDNKIAINLLQ